MAGVDKDQPSRIPRPVTSSTSGPIGVYKFSKPKKNFSSRGRFSDKMDAGNRSRTADRLESTGMEVKNFRQQLNKYCKELEDLSALQNRLQSKKEALVKLKVDYQIKYQKDPGDVPALPNVSDQVLLEEVEKLKAENSSLSKQFDDMKKQMKSTEYLVQLEAEMPKIENSMPVMLEIINNAETKQNFIEKNLETVKNEIDSILTSLKLITSGQDEITEIDIINSQLIRDKGHLTNEVTIKDRKILEMKEFIDNEQKDKQSLELNLISLNTDNIRLQERCRKLTAELELTKQTTQLPISQKTNANSPDYKELVNKLEKNEGQISALQEKQQLTEEENLGLKKELESMMKEYDQLMNDFLKTYNECLFDKEHRIYNIKCQMDEIIQLKNLVEGDGNLKYDLEVAMALDDCKSLKNEVLRYHKRWLDAVENEKKLEGQLMVKEAKINNLNNELQNDNRTIKSLENLINTLKERDKHNCLNIKNLQNSLNTKMGDDISVEDNMGQVMELIGKNMKDEKKRPVSQMLVLVSTLEQYKATLANLERKLSDLESVHSLCAERRTRNEQRIALLEIDLAKYE